ncbi:MAG: DUF3572 domain-containing protein [Rhizobiaceae bacterium]|nr:DUF3572 domain-containing protein [Rhizobiaceae bacterium]|tara:strand:- start:109 stop:381 length:273 start_codon:yes stop_codon:yes gene_type:complete
MDSESRSVDILTWITENDDLMSRFLALSGIDPQYMREAAGEPGFLAAVVGFLMEHEPTLLAYCEARNVAPEQVVSLWHELGGRSSFETSI